MSWFCFPLSASPPQADGHEIVSTRWLSAHRETCKLRWICLQSICDWYCIVTNASLGFNPAIVSCGSNLHSRDILWFDGNGNVPLVITVKAIPSGLDGAPGWNNRTYSPTWLCSLWETGYMVMRRMNSESLGRLSSYCVHVCLSMCACPAALLATVAITEQYQAAEHDTHQLDLHTPPLREEACANETQGKRERRWGGRQWGRGELRPRGKIKQNPIQMTPTKSPTLSPLTHTAREHTSQTYQLHLQMYYPALCVKFGMCLYVWQIAFVYLCRWAACSEKNLHGS